MENAIGEVPPQRLFRFPGGSSRCKNKELRTTLAELGYKGYDWNALNNDCYVKTRPAKMSEEEYLKKNFTSTIAYSLSLEAPHIVLMHETYSQSADMLAWAIDYLIEKGCTFSTLDCLDAPWYYS